MKRLLILPVFSVLALTVCFSCSHFRHRHNISISQSESDDGLYQVTAYFNESQTKKLQRYINECIKPNALFGSGNVAFDATTTLDDRTHFYIKFIPGELKIKIDKYQNSAESYDMIKKMGQGVKEVLKGD